VGEFNMKVVFDTSVS